jgi:S-formylglutathione hydrolase
LERSKALQPGQVPLPAAIDAAGAQAFTGFGALILTCRFVSFAAGILLALSVPAMLAGQGTLVADSVSSPALASNVVGENQTRQVLVYLPPSYRRDPARRFPVLYLLHGATSLPKEWVDRSYQGLDLRVAMDSLIAAAAIPEFIVVMPDANNMIQAGFYANSPATGNWEDFVARDLVRYVDRHYRTETRASRRALVGHSMGGFGALEIGFDHSEAFGLVYAVSPCCFGFVGRLAESSPAWRTLSTIKRWQDAPAQVGIVLGMASALDGSATDPRLFAELPFSARSDGSIVPDAAVQSRWLARMPPARASAMVRRGDRQPVIVIEAGSEETEILAGIELLRSRLDSLGLRYSDTTFAGGHVDRVRDRFTQHMLPVVGRWFK